MSSPVNPKGCRWRGVDEREHMQRWKPLTQRQILERMTRRRAQKESR